MHYHDPLPTILTSSTVNMESAQKSRCSILPVLSLVWLNSQGGGRIDWRKKKEVLQSMPKMQKIMRVGREPQWPELSKGFMTGKILKFLQIIYHKYATYTPVNFFSRMIYGVRLIQRCDLHSGENGTLYTSYSLYKIFIQHLTT